MSLYSDGPPKIRLKTFLEKDDADQEREIVMRLGNRCDEFRIEARALEAHHGIVCNNLPLFQFGIMDDVLNIPNIEFFV